MNTPPRSGAALSTIHIVDPTAIVEALGRLEAEVRGLRRDFAMAREAASRAEPTPPQTPVAPGSDMLSEKQVAVMVGLSARTVRKWGCAGRFPRGIPLSDHPKSKKRWVRAEIEAWLAAKAREPRP